MGKSIKRSVMIRVVCAIIATLLFSFVSTFNILRIENAQKQNVKAAAMLNQIQQAEVAHYKWSANLSNALYAGTEFTGSLDYTACVLGKWLYSDIDLDDAQVNTLRTQIEALHKQLHESAGTAVSMRENSLLRSQQFYQETIQTNLTQLVGLLDQVVERGQALSGEYTATMNSTIAIMHGSTIVCLLLSLVALISLVTYVLRYVIKPLLLITENAKPLQEGRLTLDLGYHSKNELGQLARTLQNSMGQIHSYVADINRMMSGLYALLLACKSTEYMIEEKVLYKFSLCLNVPERLFDCGAEESYKFLVYDESIA